MNKFINFYLKYRAIIAMSVLTALILAVNFFKPLWPLAVVFVVLFYFTAPFELQICYTLYLVAFSGISQIYVSALLSCFLCMIIRYIIDVKNKRKPFYKFQFFFTLAFVAVFSLIFGKIDTNGFFNWALFVALMFFIYFVFIYHDEINIKKAFDFLFVSIVVSLILGLICLPFDKLDQQIFPFDGTYNRLRLFALNVNHLAIFCIFNMCYEIYQIVNVQLKNTSGLEFFKSKEFWINLSKFVLLGIVGFMTLSKAFLLLLALVLVYFVVALIIRLKTKCWVIVVPLAVLVIVLCLIFHDIVEALVSRFFVYDIWGTFFSKIFTGRTGIWVKYLDCISSSFNKLFFGVGLLTRDIVSTGPHNTFLYFLYRVGFVGVIALVVLLVKYAKDAKHKIKPTFFNALMLLVYIVLAFEEMVFSDRFFLFLVFGIILTLVPKKEKEGQEVKPEDNKNEEVEILDPKTTENDVKIENK